jgi:DNA polymerase I-like protein with 3'-5' exonuclease and polymerase domains
VRTIAIDFEAYYDKRLNISQFGSVNYLAHPDGDIYLLAAAGDDGLRWIGRPEDFDWSLVKNARVIAHNASFDGAIFKVRPQLPRPREINCIAALSAWCGSGRSLLVASHNLLGLKISKAPRDAMAGRSWEGIPESERKALAQYCLSDAERCLELWQRYSKDWPADEQRLSELTIEMGFQGIYVDQAKLENSIIRAGELFDCFSKQIPWEAPILSNKKCAAHCQKLGLWVPKSFDKKSPERARWEQEYASAHAFVRALSDCRIANGLRQKMEAIKRRLMPNGRLNYELKYGGAHTMRWTGGGGLNLQNLQKEPWQGLYLRSLLIPEPGKKFIVCDLSAIEPRILACLVGDEQLLGLLRQGFGVYEAMAITWGMWNGAARTLKKLDPALYAFMKSMTLGCGYGMGAEKFQLKCAEAGIPMSLDEARRRINLFRDRNPLIVRQWREFDQELQRHLRKREATLYLPSGRTLHYPNLRRRRRPPTMEIDPVTGKVTIFPGKEEIVADIYGEKGAETISLWGGVITENAVQSLARDVFAASLLRLDKAGIRVVLHAHDEVLCEVGLGITTKDIEALLTVPPSWAKKLPLGAEAKEVAHYVK